MKSWLRLRLSPFLCALVLIGCAYGKHLRAGDAAFAVGDYEVALQRYEAAVAVDPSSEEAAEKVRLARVKLVEESAVVARAALRNHDLLGAMVATRRAWDRLPDAQPTRDLIAEVSEATFRRAQELASGGDFANALMLYETLGETLPSEVEVSRPHANEVRDRWSRQLEDHAVTAEAAGRKADALLAWAKLAQLSAAPEHVRQRDELRYQVLSEWGYWVQLSGRGPAYENVVAGVSGVARGSALRVAERLPTGRPADARAVLKFSRASFVTETSSHNQTVQYQSGTRQVENPFYRTKQDRLLDEERRLVDDQNEVDRLDNDVSRYEDAVAREGDTPGVSTGAEQSLSNARSRLESARRSLQDQRNAVQRAKEELAREPQTREEPVYSDHTYIITTHTRIGQLKLDATITHADRRPPIEVSDIARIEASDEAHPAQSIAGIAEDPLTLPGDGALSAELDAQAVDKSRAALAASFRSWRDTLLERANAAPNDDERVDLLVIYIVTDPTDVIPSVPADLSAMRGVPDSVRVLSATNQ